MFKLLCWRTEVNTVQAVYSNWMAEGEQKRVFELISFFPEPCWLWAWIKSHFKRLASIFAIAIGHINAILSNMKFTDTNFKACITCAMSKIRIMENFTMILRCTGKWCTKYDDIPLVRFVHDTNKRCCFFFLSLSVHIRDSF